AAGIGILTV
nr:Chain C, Peptide [synthetic construct]2GUO_F Chain F, Peptide [synthetic construct]3QDJ_C Chain C, MART-1(27-35) peptide [synthetic construct]3QEQ_C Chain C, MART-1(27-35) peptide [synthetic construct]3QFD_C Chain C, Mart-1(27-35) peptide [synthetic construct]3QFD_F Chain F, Mart-1(27-35) peptide [synthetic construct]6D78_C Chain C, Melanoma antigen recognized by T-cells 1 [Homo sapiens]6EQA_C Chain C, ALA-ALA-GLY-ILE-GLY-ILE-LEU-THR-VAL [Homo sapiens]6EQB_C Chain C, ALA-ALA-GLY-ILE-GLY-